MKKLVLWCAVFYQYGILPVCVIERGHWQVTVSVCQHLIHCNLSVTEIDTNWDDQVVHKYVNHFLFVSLTDTLMYHYVLQYIDYQRIAVLWCYRIVGHVLSIASCVACDFYFPKRSVGAHSQVFWHWCLRWYLNLSTRTVVWPKLICFITAQSVIRGKDKYLVGCKDTLWTFWPQLVPWTFLFFSLMNFCLLSCTRMRLHPS